MTSMDLEVPHKIQKFLHYLSDYYLHKAVYLQKYSIFKVSQTDILENNDMWYFSANIEGYFGWLYAASLFMAATACVKQPWKHSSNVLWASFQKQLIWAGIRGFQRSLFARNITDTRYGNWQRGLCFKCCLNLNQSHIYSQSYKHGIKLDIRY